MQLRLRMQHRSNTRAALAKALAWFCTSVRVTDSGSPDYGAILQGFDGRTKKPDYLVGLDVSVKSQSKSKRIISNGNVIGMVILRDYILCSGSVSQVI